MKPFAQALRALEAGHGVAIATVVGAHGSTPRHAGARMAVTDDGAQWGTIGGGRIEERVVAAAREVAAGGEPRTIRHHLVQDLAMCCGGAMEVAITPGAPSRAAIARLAELAGPYVLATPIDGGPLHVHALAAGEPRELRIEAGALVEVVGAIERAVVFGLGHVGRALGPLLQSLGFAVIACDDDETGALAEPPAWAARTIESFDLVDVERAIGPLTPDDFVLIVTRDHAIDQKLLEALLPRELAYLGMIGSRGKVLRFKKRLEARGAVGGWERLYAPIGVEIGAETPEEIAVAIAAQMIEVRRRGGSRRWELNRRQAAGNRQPATDEGEG